MVDIARRRVIGMLVGAAAVLAAPVRALARACRNAVIADEGPFYPVVPFPETADLLGSNRPPGQVLYLLGRVLDPGCQPIAGAVVEIWQCDAGGQYDHPRAPKTKALEAGFRYFGKVRSGSDGAFQFRTLRPSAYEVFGLKRAPHIHVRVKAPASTLTTELYFDGSADDAVRKTDSVFQGRGPRKGEMIAPLRPAASVATRLGRAPEAGALACEYDLTLS